MKENNYRFIYEYLIPKVANILDVNVHELTDKTEIFTLVDLNTTYEQPSPISLQETFYICVNTLLKISQSRYFPNTPDEIRVKIWEEVYKDREKIQQVFNINLDTLFFNVEQFYKCLYVFPNLKITESSVVKRLKESLQTQTPLIDLYKEHYNNYSQKINK